MQNIPLWNQSRLPCPSTSAHKVDLSLSTQFQGIMFNFLKNSSEESQKLKESLVMMTSEIVLLKQFLYKIAAVFHHDKSYKALKQIYKTVDKFLEADVVSDLTGFMEQHTVCFANVMFVAPKPKYEYIQVRLQGTVRLLAYILCLCQYYGKIMIQKMSTGHFVNIVTISMSFAARIWALSLHVMYLLMKLYHDISQIFKTKGLIPDSTVAFLPEDHILPLSLEHWLKSDETLKAIHPLLEKKQESKQTSTNSEIWQSIKIDDCEREQLLQLKELVTTSTVTQTGKNSSEHSSSVETLSLEKMQSNIDTDIGELVMRNTFVSVKKGKKKRAKKLNGNKLEN